MSALTRHDRRHPCPVCDGHSGLRRGAAIRCAGFSLGAVAFCTRDELAGHLAIDIGTSPPAYKHALAGPCGCGAQHAPRTSSRQPRGSQVNRRPSNLEEARLGVDERDAIYSAALQHLDLRPEARADFLRRGLTDVDIARAMYRSIPADYEFRRTLLQSMRSQFGEILLRRCPGFTDKNNRPSFWSAVNGKDGYIVPYRDEQGRITGLQVKFLGGKYLTVARGRVAEIYHVAGEPDIQRDLFVTEGGLKAEVVACVGGIWCLGVTGQSLAPEHVDAIKRLEPQRVIVALDEEANPNTDRARERWLRSVWEAGLPVFRATWCAA